MLTLSNKISPLQHLSTLNNPLKLQNFKLLFDIHCGLFGKNLCSNMRKLWHSYRNELYLFTFLYLQGWGYIFERGLGSLAPGAALLQTPGTPGARKSRTGESGGARGSARSPERRYSTLCVSLTLCGLSLFTGVCRPSPLRGPLPVIGDLLTFAQGLITVNCAPLHYALRTSRPALTHIESSSLHRFLDSVFPLSIEIVDVQLIILFIY